VTTIGRDSKQSHIHSYLAWDLLSRYELGKKLNHPLAKAQSTVAHEMSNYLGKLVFNRIFEESRENNQGRDDPYFEYVPTKKLISFSGKPSMKRRKKSLPPGLSQKDQKTLVKVKRRAYRLDMALGTCCGIKLGNPLPAPPGELASSCTFRLGKRYRNYPWLW
jgi:hypothetical protein